MMHEITIEELKEKLKRLDEVELLDILGVTSEEIVEAFEYLIEEKQDKLKKELIDDEYY
jgi:hypothetical protein